MKKWQNKTKIFSIYHKNAKTKKIYCVVCGKYKGFKNLKIWYLLEKKILSIKVIVAVRIERYLKKSNKLRHQKFLI